MNNVINFTVIKCDIVEVMQLIREILNPNDTDYEIRECDSRNLLKEIEDVTKYRHVRTVDKFVLWEPAMGKGYCIFYSNALDGRYTLLYNLAIRYKKTTLMIYRDETTAKRKMGFNYYDGIKERVVRALYDMKWTFYETGEPLSFENIENYKKRKITDRINKDILENYLLKIGLDTTCEDFYSTKRTFYIASVNEG